MSTEDKNKKKSVKGKLTKKTASLKLSALEVKQEIPPVEKNPQLEEVIKQAFLRFYDSASVESTKVKDLEHLDRIAEEYLKAFIILGYDVTGEKVTIMNAKNSQDKDALVEHLRTTLINIIGNNERN